MSEFSDYLKEIRNTPPESYDEFVGMLNDIQERAKKSAKNPNTVNLLIGCVMAAELAHNLTLKDANHGVS